MNVTVDLRHGDCLEVMRVIATGSVDAVVTDPSFQMTITANSVQRVGRDRLQAHDWEFSHDWLPDAVRVLKPGGALYVFMNDEGWSPLIADCKALGVKMNRRLVWMKSNPMPSRGKHKNYRGGTELIMYAVKGDRTAYFAERTQSDLLPLMLMPIVGGHERTPHPTQKPVRMMERFITNSCPPDGVVLDPFMGSGTTGVACVNTGRNFIGIEKDAGYFQIATERIRKAQDAPRQARLEELA